MMTLQPGEVLNQRYRMVRLLGQGGFGAVYRAWDLQMEGACALKVNLDTSPTAQAQFEREAKMLYKLRHPNLPRVFDHFVVPGQGQYLVMDYIEGEDLEAKLERSGALPVEQAYKWLGQVCDALDYLHSQDPPVIHRDLKPANVRITPDGNALLVDFGIAKVYEASKKTTVGARAVTPGYSPPEQYGSGGTDARSDVYALGATAYHMLTGRRPPASMDITAGSISRPAPVEAFNLAVSPGVSALIENAMQLNREQRLGSAGAFKAGLEEFSSMGGPMPATMQVAPTPQVAGTMRVSEPLPSQGASYPAPGSHPVTAPPARTASGARRKLPILLTIGAAMILLAVVGIAGGLLIFGGDLFSAEARVTQVTTTSDPIEAINQGSTQTMDSINRTATSISLTQGAAAGGAVQTPVPEVKPTRTQPGLIFSQTQVAITHDAGAQPAAPTPNLEPIVINVYCDVFDKSPTSVQVNQLVVLRWGWAAKTAKLVQDHIDAVQYQNTLDGERITASYQSEIEPTDDGWYRVVWSADVGVLSPGQHRTEYKETWSRQISDGETTFGPGGQVEYSDSFCDIIVQ